MKIGFLGLGRMGAPMARRLATGGHELTVWNRTLARAQEFAKATECKFAKTPREVAQSSEVVFTMLADPAAVRGVAEGGDGILADAPRGLVWIDCSTIDPDTTRDLAAQASAHSVRMLDAPVLGSIPEATEGRLLMIVGGAEQDLSHAEPLLQLLASKIYHVGGNGQGEQMKLVLNSLLGGFMDVLAESVNLGLKGALSRESLQEVIGATHMASPWVKGKLTRMFDEHGPVLFSLPMMLKDLRLIEENASRDHAAVPALQATRAEYEKAMQSGYADRDYTDIFLFVLHQGGAANG